VSNRRVVGIVALVVVVDRGCGTRVNAVTTDVKEKETNTAKDLIVFVVPSGVWMVSFVRTLAGWLVGCIRRFLLQYSRMVKQYKRQFILTMNAEGG